MLWGNINRVFDAVNTRGLTVSTITICAFMMFQAQTALGQSADETAPIVSDFEQSHQSLINDKSFDFEFTDPPVREIKVNEKKGEGAFDWEGGIGAAASSLFKLIFYGLSIAVLALIAFYIVREALNMRRQQKPAKAEKTPPVPSFRPDAVTAKTVITDAQSLADEGRYDEAVHMTLLRTIQDIKDKRPRAVPDALTSREISKLEILSDIARDAFAQIGLRVENSLFGGHSLSAEDYEASRKDYETFAYEPVETPAKATHRSPRSKSKQRLA